MPTRALGALLAAIAAAAFVVSILSGAWWDGHPRVEGRVYTAKDVHIGLLGGTGCNTGGAGDCQPLPLGSTFTTVAYGELGGLALTTAFAILIAGAAWRIAESRKRLAKLGMVIASLAAAGAIGLLVLGPQIKTTQNVVPPIGWGLFLFGGGIVAMLAACLTTLRVEREPLRLKTPKAAPQQKAPTPAPFEPAPNLRPLYDMQGASPPAFGAQRPSSPPPQAFAPPPQQPFAPPPQQAFAPPPQQAFAPPPQQAFPPPPQQAFPPPPQAFVPPPSPPTLVSPPPAPPAFVPPRVGTQSQPPVVAPPPVVPPRVGTQSQPPVVAPPAPPVPPVPPMPPIASLPRTKPPTGAPPPPMRGKPGTMPPAPFASPAIASSAIGQARPSAPSIKAPPSADPLGATIPAPAKIPAPPRVAKISVPPPRRDGGPPTPTPSIITSAPRPDASAPKPAAAAKADAPAPRPSQPTMTHSVPPMPQIDTPPPQPVRGGTHSDDSLETGMRETEIVTAVEIDHEAKARFEAEQRLEDGATVAQEPLRTSEERAAMTDEGLAAHPQGDVPGDDTDATQTATAERMDMDALQDEVASPPAKAAPREPDGPFVSFSAAARAAEAKAAAAKAEAEAAKKVPLSTAPASLPPPKSAAIPASGPTPACPQCEAPMAWVEEHLRFYCKSCRMYF